MMALMSDKTLGHAAYLSKISGAEIVLLNVIEPEIIPQSTLLTFINSFYEFIFRNERNDRY
jgi:hypothetical protein